MGYSLTTEQLNICVKYISNDSSKFFLILSI